MLKLPLLCLCFVLMGACHPLVMFSPKKIKSAPLHDDNASPYKRVHITVDTMGIPYIKAASIDDVMYGLGFMHARDRLFQIDLARHAAQGRLSELFGERTLKLDKALRVLTYRLDEQLAHLSHEENMLVDNYLAGINDGAKQRGRTAEHFFLGIEFAPLTRRDVIAIARLQSWTLASDLHAEIARLKVARTTITPSARDELLAAADDRGSAILGGTARFTQRHALPDYLDDVRSIVSSRSSVDDDVVQTSGGASNAWAINGRLAEGGNAMLMNDPHLQHTWPSNFYLATLEADRFFVTGASFVGLPGILVGATKKLAWGVTASMLNTQDAVLLKMDGDDAYLVDNKRIELTKWPQRYCTNKKGACKEEMQYVSIFGPVMDERVDNFIDKNDRFAVQWTGFVVDKHKNASSGFLTLAHAKDVDEGVRAVKAMTLPGVNIVLADRDSNIAYGFAGIVPVRDSSQHPFLPLDGARGASLWTRYLSEHDVPSTINPSEGFIVTANQNIFARDAHAELSFGKQGAPPYRAMRIRERIAAMTKNNALINFDDLSTVQLDETSTEARELAPQLGAICEEVFRDQDGYRQAFARAVKSFDGRYTTDSKQALPYEMLIEEIVSARLRALFTTMDSWSMGHVYQMRFTIKNALRKELAGETPAIFAGSTTNDNATSAVRAACEPAYQSIVKRASKNQWAWRWGRHHFIKRQSPFGQAPLIGGLFRDKKREVAGVQSAPLAEAGLPVRFGANLRFRVKLTDPPQIFAVVDAGNSGTIGSKNAFDQAALWHAGKDIPLDIDWSSAFKKSVQHFVLERSAVTAKK